MIKRLLTAAFSVTMLAAAARADTPVSGGLRERLIGHELGQLIQKAGRAHPSARPLLATARLEGERLVLTVRRKDAEAAVVLHRAAGAVLQRHLYIDSPLWEARTPLVTPVARLLHPADFEGSLFELRATPAPHVVYRGVEGESPVLVENRHWAAALREVFGPRPRPTRGEDFDPGVNRPEHR